MAKQELRFTRWVLVEDLVQSLASGKSPHGDFMHLCRGKARENVPPPLPKWTTSQQVARLTLCEGAEPFPGYSLLHLLGRGGWGEVWRARRPNGPDLALKFLASDSQLASAQEIRALQAIRTVEHPNLIKIEQVWCCAGYLVIAMELAEGSLYDLLEIYLGEFQKPLFPDHAIFFLKQVALALDFLNARQHVVNGQRLAFRHCDVKPSNILVLGKLVKLADFSLSVATSATRVEHRRVGTPIYAAPEVFQGWLSDRTDQFALAVTYCLVRGGRVPFQNVPNDFVPYVHPAPDLTMVTPAERPVLARALAPIPLDRWPSCGELMERLEQALRMP